MLDKETLRTEVLSMALSKGDMEDNTTSRIICARILGAMAQYMVSNKRALFHAWHCVAGLAQYQYVSNPWCTTWFVAAQRSARM